MANDSGVRVLSIVFGEQWIEVNYVGDEEDANADVVDLHQRLIKPTLFNAEIEDILDSIVEVMDRAAIHKRNPTTSFRRPHPGALEEDV